MLNFIAKQLMNKKDDEGGGGGPPKDVPPPKDPPIVPPEPPKEEVETDELGYAKKPPEEKKEGAKDKPADKSKEAPPEKPEKVENPVSGYDKEPEEVKDEVPPPKPPPAEPPGELDKKLEGLHKGFAEAVKKQIGDLGLEGEKLDKFIAFKKQEHADAQAWGESQQRAQKIADQKQKAAWHKELKADPVFGGEKFLVNVDRAEKVLDEHLPELKKELTEHKQMLRPSVMRGLARLADKLYPEEKMVQGDPPIVEKEDEEKSDDPLDFYKS